MKEISLKLRYHRGHYIIGGRLRFNSQRKGIRRICKEYTSVYVDILVWSLLKLTTYAELSDSLTVWMQSMQAWLLVANDPAEILQEM